MKTGKLTPASAYREMALIRNFEERALALSVDGMIAGSTHFCFGQEAIPVGTTAALQPQDRVLATYRGHGWTLACGSDPTAVLAEIAQREGGINGGRAGSPMMSDPEIGFLGENSIIGAGIPIAAGVAMASVAKGEDRVIVASLGDGAMNQGATTEGMILAAVRNLPIIYILENNGWSEMTPISTMMRGDDLARRADGLGIRNEVVDGDDPFAVEAAVTAAAEICRRGEGPVLLECKTHRLRGHYNRDIEHYRPKTDIAAAQAADPLVRLAQSGALSAVEVEAINEDVKGIIERAAAAVVEMPAPDPVTVFDHLYGEQVAVDAPSSAQPLGELTYQRAINIALKEELTDRPDVLLYGEDVGYAGGIFGVTRSLQKQFGAERVFDTPIAESAILGSAVGAALAGLRPVVEIMWADFVFVAFDQIINQASNVRYVSRSKLTAPLTIRMQQGVTPGSCAQHSQSIEAFLAHIPGIKVGLPATPQDAYAMTRAAIADPDPTVLVESRSLYQETGEVVGGAVVERAEGARAYGEGADVAIITWSAMLHRALAAAEELKSRGIDATVLDIRWVRPLDRDAIRDLVTRASGRVLVVHEATLSGGFGAEVAAAISEECFEVLDGPVRRLATPDVRMPSAPALQDALIPSVSAIVDAAAELAARPQVVKVG